MSGTESEPKHILQALSGKREQTNTGEPKNQNSNTRNIYSVEEAIRNAQNQSEIAGIWHKNQRRASLAAHGKDEFGKNIGGQA